MTDVARQRSRQRLALRIEIVLQQLARERAPGREGKRIGRRRNRRNIDEHDIERQRVRRRIDIDATSSRAPIIFHLKRKGRIGGAPAVCRGSFLGFPRTRSTAGTICPATTGTWLSVSDP